MRQAATLLSGCLSDAGQVSRHFEHVGCGGTYKIVCIVDAIYLCSIMGHGPWVATGFVSSIIGLVQMSSSEQNEDEIPSEPQNNEVEISMVTEVVEEAVSEHDENAR